MRVLAVLSAVLVFAVCTTSKPPEPPIQQSIMLKEETKQYRFVFEAGPKVLEIPGFAEALHQEAAHAQAQLIKDNAEFRTLAPDDPRDVQIAYEAIWSRGADAGSLASVRMDFYGYGGGAHPIMDFDGRIFDKASGKRLSLSDLLNRPVQMSGIPNALCKAIEDEKKARDLPFEDAGDPITCTGPEPSLKLDGPIVFAASTEPGKAAGLRYLFGPYAIGAYVEGPYVIDVPAAAFITDMKPEYAAAFGGDFDANDPRDPAADMPYIGGGDR